MNAISSKPRRTLIRLGGAAGAVALTAGLAGPLAGCGFALRRSQVFPFERIYLGFAERAPLGLALRRALTAAGVQVMGAREIDRAQVILDPLQETHEKVVVGLNSAGQVREFQLRLRFRYKLRAANGTELTPPTDLELTRDLSFNESNVLAKEAEEALILREMQNDLVQQLLRRLAAVNLHP